MKDIFDEVVVCIVLFVKWAWSAIGASIGVATAVVPKAINEVGWELFAFVVTVVFLAIFKRIFKKSLQSYLFRFLGVKDELTELRKEVEELKKKND